MADDINVLKKEMTITAEHSAMNGFMRLSSIFAVFQDMATLDADRVGFGSKFTEEKNLLWMIVKSCVKINRIPKYEEHVIVSTWTGKSGHGLFLRHYEISDLDGNSLIQSNATWVLVNAETRVLDPEPGAEFTNMVTGHEIKPSKRIRLPELTNSTEYKAAYSQIDINKHLNNTKYFEIAEDLIPIDYLLSHTPAEASVDYLNEIRPDEKFNIKWVNDGNDWYFDGSTDKNCFTLKLTYK